MTWKDYIEEEVKEQFKFETLYKGKNTDNVLGFMRFWRNLNSHGLEKAN